MYNSLDLKSVYYFAIVSALLSPFNKWMHGLFLFSQFIFIALVQVHTGRHPDTSAFAILLNLSVFFLAITAMPLDLKNRLGSRQGRGTLLIWVNWLVGLYYFFPVLEKIRISPNLYEWALTNQSVNILGTSCNYGWGLACQLMDLAWINYGTIAVFIFEIISIFPIPGKFVAILCAVRVVFHISIFFLTGDLFPGLILVNSVLAYYNFKTTDWTFKIEKLATAIVVTAVLFFNMVPWLGWFDLKLNQKYSVYVVTESGKKHLVDYDFWGNYSSYSIYLNLSFLVPQETPALDSSVSDTIHFSEHRQLLNVKTAADYAKDKLQIFETPQRSLEEKNIEQKKFTEFITTYVTHKCSQGIRTNPRWIRHYYLTLSSREPALLDCPQERIAKLEVVFAESLFLDGKIVPIGQHIILQTPLP